jgi:hypothetical protein
MLKRDTRIASLSRMKIRASNPLRSMSWSERTGRTRLLHQHLDQNASGTGYDGLHRSR